MKVQKIISFVERWTSSLEKSLAKHIMIKLIFWISFVPTWISIPSIIYNHLVKGPPAKSWTLGENLLITLLRKTFENFELLTIEQVQLITTNNKYTVPNFISSTPFIVPVTYRKIADDIVSKQTKIYGPDKVDWNLKAKFVMDDMPDLKGEWLHKKDTEPLSDRTLLFFHGGSYFFGSYINYKKFLFDFAQNSNGRVCAVDYRLAPQYPFPSAVEDALSTYLFLIDPPKESRIPPTDPKKVFLCGDSCGGGLATALLIAIRDAGLPAPAGAILFSPLLDLTYSFPSVLSNMKTDFLPPAGHVHAPSPALDAVSKKIRAIDINNNETNEKANEMEEEEHLEIQKVSIDDMVDDYSRFNFYIPNCGVKLPLVSPAFDNKKLRGLPKILLQCGSCERVRDDSIYGALLGTGYFEEEEKSEELPPPTQMILEICDDQPHDFHFLMNNKTTRRAIKNAIDFFNANDPTAVSNDYQTDETLTISNISVHGDMTDIKTDFLNSFTEDKWTEWKRLLARTSVKERVNLVQKYHHLTFFK